MKILCLFFMSVVMFQSNLIIQDQYEMDHIKITYGTYLEDAYMMISDIETEEVYNEIVLDEGSFESFIYLAEVNHHQFIMILEKYNEKTNENLYSLMLYNIYGELINRQDLIDKPSGFYNHHHVLVIEIEAEYFYVSNDLYLSDELVTETNIIDNYTIQYQGQAYVNDQFVDEIMIDGPGVYEIKIVSFPYEYVEIVVIDPKIHILGEIYSDGYIGDVQIFSTGELYINGKECVSGDIISKPGFYEVNIFGEKDYIKTFSLSIYPTLVYYDGDDQFPIKGDMVFDYPIRLYSNVDSIKVNGEHYFGGLLTNTDDYFIELMVNDIVIETMNISLISSVNGVNNLEKYEEVKLYAFGKVFLNGSKIEGFHLIKEPGTYQIRMMNHDGTYEEIKFYISGSYEEDNSSLLVYGILMISVIGLAIILFKK